MTIARDLGFEVRERAAAPQRPLHRRRDVRHRHRGRGRADPLGRRPRDRRARARSPARSRRRTSPPSAARSTSTRTGWSMSVTTLTYATRWPAGSRSTTRRCATARSSRASRSPSTTSCASPSSSTGSASHYIEAGWPGANPKDDELFRRAPTELQLEHEHARRVRLDPPGEGQGRLRRHAAPPRRGRTSARCASSASRGTTTCSRRSAPRSTRAWRWSPTRSSSCAATGCDVLFDAEHFFDGYKRNPEFALRVLEARGAGGRRPPRAVRHQRRRAARTRSSAIVARGRRLLRRRRRRRRAPPRRRRHAAWPTRSPACAAARRRCRARSTATASAPATATSPRSSRTSR